VAADSAGAAGSVRVSGIFRLAQSRQKGVSSRSVSLYA
jgi:hypothetical protein